MSVRDALEEFKTHNTLIKESLDKLRNEVKKEGSYKIQNHMLNDKFDEANKVMKMLEEFIGIELNSNSDEISQYVNTLFKEGFNKEEGSSNHQKREEDENQLTFIEREILEEIGYTSVSSLKNMKITATEKNIQDLSHKGFLNYETVKWGNENFLAFEFTEKGKLYFRNRYGIEAVTKREEKKEKNLNIQMLQNELREMNYDIINTREEIIEINMENKSCYLMIPKESVEEQMNQFYKLKNIGFICKDEDQTNQTFERIKQWVTKNKDKTKLLAIHFTTLRNIKENPKSPFKTIRF